MQFKKILDQTEVRFEELSQQLADPEIISDGDRYRKAAKQRSDLEEVVTRYREWKRVDSDLEQALSMVAETDPELKQMAADEIARLEPVRQRIEDELKILLLPKDPLDEKNVVLEIRAGTGGDEATLFAAEIFRMYSRYAETKHWRIDVTSVSESSVGGLKEVIALINGDKVFSKMKYESGVHRVQRVPETEQQGRVHTSAITVAVLPEADEVEVKLEAKDIRIDTFCSSGPGGQSVNTTYSGGAHHALADRAGGFVPGREIADQESRQSRARAALAALRAGAGKAAGRAGRRAAQHGGDGRPQREDPHLQLPAESGDRSSHRADAASARPGDGRPARYDHRSSDPALSDGKDEGAGAKSRSW